MSQPDLINQPILGKKSEENCLTDILTEIQTTPQQYWPNLLQIMRIFRESVTHKPELLIHDQPEIDTQNQEILNQQSQALKELTKEWLEEGEQEDQTETWESLSQEIDDNPF